MLNKLGFLKAALGRNHPMTLLALAIGGTTIVVLTYKFSFKPYLDKKRLREAEEVANFIYERENRSA